MDTSLTDLCSTCHIERPKYRCPRCKAQTCSLPCYKRHQQRASCNGQRDPTKFVKKSQWATPSGIDHDYNYLRTVERSIEGAGHEAQARGIGVAEHGSKGAARAWLSGSTLQRYLTRHRIAVKHAPTGMSRQKSNQTRVTKRGNVVWTVEWVAEDGRSRLNHECNADVALDEVHRTLQAESKKTKRKQTPNDDLGDISEKRQRTDEADLRNEGSAESLASHQRPPDSNSHTSPDASHSPGEGDAQQDSTEPDKQIRNIHFYLRKPATASPEIVLIPLNPTATLTESLQDRTVQEYPTIYTLQALPAALPAGFILEADYLTSSTTKRPQLHDNGIKPEPIDDDEQSFTAERKDVKMDPKAILDMLKRDVTV